MSYSLTIEPLGMTIEVAPGQNMLDAALRHGVWLPHACGHGLCGTCKVDVLGGEVEHNDASPFALMDVERDEGKTLACCATLSADTVIEAEIDEEPDARVIPVRDFNGRVERIVDVTPTIRAVHVALDSPIDFQAGQYVNLDIPGVGSRPFSIATAPGTNAEHGNGNGNGAGAGTTHIELDVRRVSGGAGTAYVHQTLREGDPVRLAGPYGRFFVRKSHEAPLLFMAGGSGLSSPRSMILDLLAEGCARPITLVYGQRTLDELYYHDELSSLAAMHPNFRYVPALSAEPDGSAWRGARGFVHEAAKELFGGDFRGQRAYLCGPPPMIEACVATLMQGRLFERDIFTERFLSAADGQQARSPLFKRI